MHAVDEGKIKINDRTVTTYGRAVLEEDTALHVMAGTTGYKGGRRAAGGRTYIRLECFSGDFLFDPVLDDDGRVTGIEIACCGDDALDAIAKAVRFVKDVIEEERLGIDQ